MIYEDKLKNVSVTGLEAVGKGKCGNVYALSEDRIIKTFHSFIKPEEVEKERDNAKRMHDAGVPTPEVFDIVRTQEGLGLIYERVNAMSLEKLMRAEPSRMPEYAERFGKLGRHIHSIKAGGMGFITAKQDYRNRLQSSRERIIRICGPEAYDEVVKILEAIPDAEGMVHGDFHPDNVLVQDGKLILIDMADVMSGHPVFDLLGLYFLRVYKVRFQHIVESRMSSVEDERVRKKVSEVMEKMQSNTFSEEESDVFWSNFIRAYLDTDDSAVINAVTKTVEGFSRLYMVCMERSVSFLGDEIVDMGTEAGVRELLEQKDELVSSLSVDGFVLR